MNVGVVGVGRWGRTVATSFTNAGHVVTAHDRHDKSKFCDLGEQISWPKMITERRVDAVVCATPPDVTKAVFDACQGKRMPCFLTKPFMIVEPPKELTAPAYVDYIHLASPVYNKLKKSATIDYGIEKMEVSFYGCGPDRSFPGLLDYGAHALTIVHDLVGLGPLEIVSSFNDARNKPGPKRDLIRVEAKMKKIEINIHTGNGATSSKRRVEVWLSRGPRITYEECNRVESFEIDGKVVMSMKGNDPLTLMVDRFAWDVDAGRVNPCFIELSAAVTRSLGEIRTKISP
jgi:hypothetical protein